MLKIEFTIDPNDPRFAAIMAVIGGAAPSVPVAEAVENLSTADKIDAFKKKYEKKAPIEKPAPEVVETAAEAKPVSLELIREKIVEYTGKDKEKYTPLIKGLLAEFGQKSASNLLKADYDSFYTQLAAL